MVGYNKGIQQKDLEGWQMLSLGNEKAEINY